MAGPGRSVADVPDPRVAAALVTVHHLGASPNGVTCAAATPAELSGAMRSAMSDGSEPGGPLSTMMNWPRTRVEGALLHRVSTMLGERS